ncbi:MAG: YdjY domain-containing protein [Acidobacteriota bacterium]
MALLFTGMTAAAQKPEAKAPARPGPSVEKIRDGVYRVGNIQVDTIGREAAVEARINSDVTTLEFVANKVGGAKAYESALTVMTDATTLNAALLLLGLDPAHSRVPTRHFDPVPPKGDPVELWIEWADGTATKRARIEQLLYDTRTKTTLPEGPWVYTGSTFSNGQYMAEVDGVLIGFVHSPAPLIENPRAGAVDAYGFVVLNPQRSPGMLLKAKLVIKALGPAPKGKL